MALWASPATDEMGETRAVVQVNAVYVLAPRVRQEMGRGVCGTSAQRRETVIVPDVHAFPGHIACDTASRSEIVVPLLHAQQLLGVLDLDSPDLARFDSDDANGLNSLANQLLEKSDWSWLVG